MSRKGLTLSFLVVIALWAGALVLQRHEAVAEARVAPHDLSSDRADTIMFVGHGEGKTADQAFMAAEKDAENQADRVDEKLKRDWTVKYPYWEGKRTARVEREGTAYKATYTITANYTWRQKNEGGVK